MVLDIINSWRVQADPNKVPRPASMNRTESPFARELERVSESAPRNEDAGARRRIDDHPDATENQPQNETEVATDDARTDDLPTEADTTTAPERNAAPPVGTEVQRQPTNESERRVAARQTPPGKGSADPDAPTQIPTRAVVAAPQPGSDGGGSHPPTVSLSAGLGANVADVPKEVAGDARITGVAASERGSSVRTTHGAPGYRTYSPQLLQAAEQARDSVFRQIVFRVTGESSEMRVLLDPPELGQMDMTMVLDKAGVLQLSITAERPELALMLNKHMPELRQALAAQGLDIGSADVGTRDPSSQQQSQPRRGPHPHDDITDPEVWVRQGYIRADGLDFWV